MGGWEQKAFHCSICNTKEYSPICSSTTTEKKINQKFDQSLEGLIKRGGRLDYEPINKNIWPKRQGQKNPTRKQPERATKRALSFVDETKYKCSCKYDGKNYCEIGQCSNDCSSMECNENICSFKDKNCGNRKYLRPYLTSCVRKTCKKLEGDKLNSGLVAFECIPKSMYIGQYVGVIKEIKDGSGSYCANFKVGGKSVIVDSGERGILHGT